MINRLMSIKSDCDRYRGELRVLAADAGMDEAVATYLFIAAKYLNSASSALKRAVLQAEEDECHP